MPQAVPLAVKIALTYLAANAAAVIAVASLVISMIMARKAQKTPNTDNNRRQMTTVRGSTETQNVIYGEARVGGVVAFADTKDLRQWGDTGKSDLFMVIAVAPHPIQSYQNLYVDDKDLRYFQDHVKWVDWLDHNNYDYVKVYFHRDMSSGAYTWSGSVNGTDYEDQLYSDFDSIMLNHGIQVYDTTLYNGNTIKWMQPQVIPVVWTVKDDGQPANVGTVDIPDFWFALWNPVTKEYVSHQVTGDEYMIESDFSNYWSLHQLDGTGNSIVSIMEPKYVSEDNLWYYPRWNGSAYETESRELDPRDTHRLNVQLSLETFSSSDGNPDNTGYIDASTSRSHGILDVQFYRGGYNQASSRWMNIEFPDKWTTDHIGIGVSYFVTHLFFDYEQHPNGMPNYTVQIEGKNDLIDPRNLDENYDLSDKEALRLAGGYYTNNAAIVIMDYLISPFGLNADLTEIDIDSFSDAADICDELIPLVTPKDGTIVEYTDNPVEGRSTTINVPGHGFSSGNMCAVIQGAYNQSFYVDTIDDDNITVFGQVPITGAVTCELWQFRYRIDGAIDTSTEVSGVIEQMLVACGYGSLTFDDGKYKLKVGSWTPPVAEITEDWIISDVQVQPRMSREKLFNGVKGTYISKYQFWQSTDFEDYSNPYYCQEDNQNVECNVNDYIYQDTQYPFFLEPMRCKRMAKLYLEKARQALTVSLTCNLKAYQIDVADTVQLSIEGLGFVQKEFEVISWELTTDATVNLTLQETAAAVYDFDYGEYVTQDLAPNTQLPDLTLPNTFASVDLSTSAYFDTGGTLKEQIIVRVTLDTDLNYVTYDNVEIEYRDVLIVGDDWKVASRGKSLVAAIEDVKMSLYAVRVRGTSNSSPPTQWFIEDIRTQGAGSVITEVTLPDPIDPRVYFSIQDNKINKLKFTCDWKFSEWKDQPTPPEFVLLMYSAEEDRNELVMNDDGLIVYSGEVVENGSLPVLDDGTNTVNQIKLFPDPVDTGVDLTGKWWCRVKKADLTYSVFSKVNWYDEHHIYLNRDLSFVPTVGDTLEWWYIAFHDTRLGEFKLGSLWDPETNVYEVIRWDDLYWDGTYFKIVGEDGGPVERAAEGSTKMDATQRLFSYYPALGPGTSVVYIPASAFTSLDSDTLTTTYSVDINLPERLGWGAMTVCFGVNTVKDGTYVLARSNVVLPIYSGES